jgi:hypothetical protein
MYLLITAAAAVVTTVLWRKQPPADPHSLRLLCLIYWGAALMWLVDMVMVWPEEGVAALNFTPNAALLGIASIACGLLLWGICRLFSRKAA